MSSAPSAPLGTSGAPRFRLVRRIVRLLVILAAAAFLVLWIRPLFAEPLDLGGYIPKKDAEAYRNLPFSGPNFAANSRIGHGAGRYYLKGKAAACVLAAYAELEKTHPDRRFLYAEMGWKGGGPFRPHRTHRRGLSADFMTPVCQTAQGGKKVPTVLPCNATNLWGYAIRIDADGRFADYSLDTEAMIAQLAALQKHAGTYGLRVERVIFDPPLLRLLRKDPQFSRIASLRFMAQKAWFPHDGHYHVDFVGR